MSAALDHRQPLPVLQLALQLPVLHGHPKDGNTAQDDQREHHRYESCVAHSASSCTFMDIRAAPEGNCFSPQVRNKTQRSTL